MSRPTVLVVDDDAFSRRVVARKLAALANVIEAEDGFDALRSLQTTAMDLAVVDLEMPNCNGVDLIKCMRGHPALKHIPIIVLTANESRSGLEDALTAGATSFLLKPLNWGVFGGHIRHVLELAYRAGHMALHDHLTGLPNRVLLNERLEHALALVKEDALVATHIVDLDQFKHVNDTLGHPTGDRLLKIVAERLRKLLREGDTVARMGGDEFAVVQANIADKADADSLARRMIDLLSQPYELSGRNVLIGATVGIAVASAPGLSAEKLMRDADVALYRAKGEGRGISRFFDPAMDALVQARAAMAYDLRTALPSGEFGLHYQPLINLGSGRISGFEALMRWCHPHKGMVLPGNFIPLAEEIGLIVPISEWVLREACKTAAQWPGDLWVSVNISPAHFRDVGLVQAVARALDASSLAPHRLEIEITETHLLQNNSATLETLHRLRNIGVRIAMDDFGTGYSSLSYLQSFPFDKIKIDRSFVKNITEVAGSLNIVRAVAALAKGLDIVSTAEGVETEEQLARISAEGYTEAQGFLFSRPIPSDEIVAMLRSEQVRLKIKGGAIAA